MNTIIFVSTNFVVTNMKIEDIVKSSVIMGLSQKTVFQIAQYNRVLQVERLVISNGNQHFNCTLNEDVSLSSMQNGIPSWHEN